MVGDHHTGKVDAGIGVHRQCARGRDGQLPADHGTAKVHVLRRLPAE
jgi:hypothetical protein